MQLDIQCFLGLLHPTGANDVLSYPLYVRDSFLYSFLLSLQCFLGIIIRHGANSCGNRQNKLLQAAEATRRES